MVDLLSTQTSPTKKTGEEMPVAAIMLDQELLEKYAKLLPTTSKNSDASRRPYIDTIVANRKLLEAKQPRQNKPWPSCYEGTIPSLKSDRDTLVARMIRALLAVDPIIYAAGKGEWKEYGDEMQNFFQHQFTIDFNLRRVMERIFQACLDDGVAIAYVTWKQVTRKLWKWDLVTQNEIDPTTGQDSGKSKAMAAAEFVDVEDRPDVSYVPIENFGCYPPIGSEIQDCDGVYFRYPMSGDDMMMGVASGDFDPDAVELMKTKPSDWAKLKTSTDASRGINATSDDPADFQSRMYQMTDYYWRVVVNPDEPSQDWLITMHDDSGVIIRAIPNPWWHGQRPFVEFRPFLDKEGIGGDSLADKAGPLQEAQTTLLRLGIDAMTVGINPEVIIPKSGGLGLMNDMKRNRGPLGVIAVPDQYVDKIKPFNPGYHPNAILPMEENIRYHKERATGISDTMRGVANPRQLTATEVANMIESGQELIAMIMDRLADSLTDVAKMIFKLDMQFAGSRSLQQTWENANPNSEVDLATAIVGDYDILANGTRQTTSQAQRAQRSQLLLTTLAQSEFVAPFPLRMFNLLRNFCVENGFPNYKDLIGTEQEARIQQQQKAALLGNAMTPQGGGQLSGGTEQPEQPGALPGAGVPGEFVRPTGEAQVSLGEPQPGSFPTSS